MPLAVRRTVPLLAFLLGLLASCTVGPSGRPPVAVRDAGTAGAERPQVLTPREPVEPAPPGRYDPTSLPWQDCTAALAPALGPAAPPLVECADIRVDADLAIPGIGGSLRLDVSRVGSGPAPLVVLGEAGGEIGTVRAARLAGQLPPEVLEQYTLIGLARRGTGPTEPIDCVPPDIRAEIIGADPDPRRPEQLVALLDTTSTAIQTCVQQLNQLLTAIDSQSTAADLEQLRVALGAPVVNLLSLGEGSRSAMAFLQRYPGSAGRVVLDGAPDPALDLTGAAEAAAGAAEQGFEAFAADCVDRNCPLAPDPRQALLDLAEALRRSPLPTPPEQGTSQQEVSAGTAYQAVLTALPDPQRWPELADALAAARDRDSSGLAAIVAPLVAGTPAQPARFDPALATRCNDSGTRVPPERAGQLVAEWRDRYALFGPLFAQRLLLCSAWPVPAKAPEDDGVGVAPPLIVIATEGDPVTAADGTRRAADELPSAVMVNWQGRAHGAVGRSPCVTDVVTRYLVDAELPVAETLCPP